MASNRSRIESLATGRIAHLETLRRAAALVCFVAMVCTAAVAAEDVAKDAKPAAAPIKSGGASQNLRSPSARSPKNTAAPPKAPEVTGAWTGEWGPYNPAESSGPVKEKCKALDCVVEAKDGAWHATFEGECGRPYKYRINMDGRQAGGAVLFKGTTDLGEADGGVFDWVGRATDDEFVGFYTSARYTGFFSLKRVKNTATQASPGAARATAGASTR